VTAVRQRRPPGFRLSRQPDRRLRRRSGSEASGGGAPRRRRERSRRGRLEAVEKAFSRWVWSRWSKKGTADPLDLHEAVPGVVARQVPEKAEGRLLPIMAG